MVQKFSGKVSRNPRNCLISEMRTIQPKILEVPEIKVEKLGIPSEVVHFLEILKNAVPLATGSCGSSNRTFWLNEKRPNCDQFSWKEERPWELD